MSETTMPATEAEAAVLDEERVSYELAFHVLPTVAEGEVPGVFEAVKEAITKAGGELNGEEAPERFDLAYEIVKYLEGKNRTFTSAYFGWIRFMVEPSAIAKIEEAVAERNDILRFLIIRLSKVEEANPFRFHEAIKAVDDQKSMTVDVDDAVDQDRTVGDERKEVTNETTDEKNEETGEVDEEALEEALKKQEA